MIRHLYLTLLFFALVVAIEWPNATYAATIPSTNGITQVGFAEGGQSSLNSVAQILWDRIVNRIFLPVIGGLAVLALIYAGIQYATANGNQEPVKKARQAIINISLALIILVASYTILGFIIGVIRFTANQAG